jgi:protein-L-isoaspartate O-methyltransferase
MMSSYLEGPDGALTFHFPEVTSPIERLLAEYDAHLSSLRKVADLMGSNELKGCIGYFIEGNSKPETLLSSRLAASLFKIDGAVKALDADCWSKAIALTDVLEVMPQKRREEWGAMIRDNKTPPFERETVFSTLTSLMNDRERFLAERVDGIFRSLSGEHVTNQPQGFYKRMIIGGVVNSFGFPDYKRCGYIADLRSVVARFMGREEPSQNTASSIVALAYESPGQWHIVDGGSIRLKVFKKGTAHLEVHEELAWRLNAVLANLYPGALPPNARKRPKAAKVYPLRQRYLPQGVLDLVMQMMRNRRYMRGNQVEIPYDSNNQQERRELKHLLTTLGGAPTGSGDILTFDYDPREVLERIAVQGYIPDELTHQFYCTSPELAERVVNIAGIEPGMTVLEPSAGTGALARLCSGTAITCVEVSELRCQILKEQGLKDVVESDFLEWASEDRQYNRIIMNPPFSKGRAQQHLTAAAGCLAEGGRLVAILPASMKGKQVLEGFSTAWSEELEDQFIGTGVRVVILTAHKGKGYP